MNRAKAETIADRIMTRIETDKAIHKDAIADEIQAGDALDEIVDIISHDGEKWVHRDGTPFDTDADVKQEGIEGANPKWTDDEIARIKARPRVGPIEPNRIMTGTGLLREMSDRAAIQKAWRDMLFTGTGIYRLQPDGFWSADLDDRDTA